MFRLDYVATNARAARDACAVLGWNSFQKSALNGRNSCKEQLILVKKKKKRTIDSGDNNRQQKQIVFHKSTISSIATTGNWTKNWRNLTLLPFQTSSPSGLLTTQEDKGRFGIKIIQFHYPSKSWWACNTREIFHENSIHMHFYWQQCLHKSSLIATIGWM